MPSRIAFLFLSQNIPPAILNRTLIIDDNNQPPPMETIASEQYSQPSLDSSRSWLLDDDEDGVLEFENVRILRRAHLAAETNLTRSVPSIRSFRFSR